MHAGCIASHKHIRRLHTYTLRRRNETAAVRMCTQLAIALTTAPTSALTYGKH